MDIGYKTGSGDWESEDAETRDERMAFSARS